MARQQASGGPEPAMAAAIDWMVRLRSGEVSAAEMQRFEHWRSADAANAGAWLRLEDRLAQPVQALAQLERRLPGQQQQIRGMLARPARRSALRALLLLAPGAGALALAVNRFTPVSQLMADLRTGTGERRGFTLPDGSRLTLNARSAADLAFDAGTREVRLLQGDAIVQVAAGASAAPPFCVRTPHARLYAEGRLSVGLAHDCTQVFALQGPVRLVPHGGAEHLLAAGQGAELDDQGLRPGVQVPAGMADWEGGYLSAAPMPLGEVIAALQRYTPRLLHISDRAAALAVHASLPLDDVDRSLLALAESLPIRVRMLSPWVARIDVAVQA